YMINPEGYILQGYISLPGDQGFEDIPSDILINTRSSVPGEASTLVQLTTNLDANTEIMADPFDITDPVGTSNFATTTEIYDSLGMTHLVTTYFRKDALNQWTYHLAVPGEDIGSADDLVLVGSGTLTFDESGMLTNIAADHGPATDPTDPDWPTINAIEAGLLNWDNGARQGDPLDYEMNITQFSTESRVVTQQTDGYSSGTLTDVSVDQEGVITGTYSNGETRDLARLALGKFANESGLEKLGNNLFAPTRESGPADIGPQGEGFGRIFSNALEQSTVDIAEEFIRMITVQRAFQANSKTITTTDEMLNDVINMKR
ncbi:MAG: flagellar hook-basal body complex protein, partial [Deltaproteobacteria bacterium]|nr:flagellar hook-basal body complex protein [Deltaproteobacteria bacterium]